MQRREMYSVIIPVYNEEAVISTTYMRLKSVMEVLDGDYELIFVNDGSNDNSEVILEQIGDEDPSVKLVAFSRNFGHQIAISAGMDYAIGDAVIVIDADLQDPPELIAEMVDKWHTGYDVVYAKRQTRLGETQFKLWTASLFYRTLSAMTDVDIPLDTGDFRLIDRKVCDVITSLPEQHRFVRGLVAWAGFRQTAVVYERAPRFAGETKYPLKRMLRLAGDAITAFSDKPLKLPLYVGSVLLPMCMLLMLYWIATMIGFHKAYAWSDWLSLVSILCSSVVLIALGLVGQYLSRMYDDVRGRPLYVVGNRQGFSAKDTATPRSHRIGREPKPEGNRYEFR